MTEDSSAQAQGFEPAASATSPQHHGFLPAPSGDRPPGLSPQVATNLKDGCDRSQKGEAVVEEKAPEPAKKTGSHERGVGTDQVCAFGLLFPRMSSFSWAAMLVLISTLGLGVWMIQLLHQHRVTETLLMSQDKAQRHELSQLNEQLVDISDQKTELQRRVLGLQHRAAELQKQAADSNAETAELQERSQQRDEDYADAVSSRDNAIQELRGDLEHARKEQNATVADLMHQLSRKTELDQKNAANAEALLKKQELDLKKQELDLKKHKLDLNGEKEQLQQDQREIHHLRQDLQDSRSSLARTQDLLRGREQIERTYQKAMTDSATTWQRKLKVLQGQKDALRHELDGERETVKRVATTAKAKLQAANVQAKKGAAQAVAKFQAKLTLQENLVQSLLQQLQKRTRERDAGQLHVAQLRRRLHQEELEELERDELSPGSESQLDLPVDPELSANSPQLRGQTLHTEKGR